MKTVLLTGCSKGIGNSILTKLLSLNKYSIIAISKNVDSLKEIKNRNLHLFQCDLQDTNAAIKRLQEIRDKFPYVDAIINNAGIGIFGLVEELELEDWNTVMTINLTIPFLIIKYLLPGLKKKGAGAIINITSDADYLGFSTGSAYCASKFGLRGFSDALRQEVKGTKISITTIGPGRVDTYFNNKKPGDRPISLSAADVANQVVHVLGQRDRCGIERIYLNSTLE